MTVEMKSRMRATAPVRSGPRSRHAVNPVYGSADNKSTIRHKCWFCSDSRHWPDQCEKFADLSMGERINAAKNNRLCFSCLKKADPTNTATAADESNVRRLRIETSALSSAIPCCIKPKKQMLALLPSPITKIQCCQLYLPISMEPTDFTSLEIFCLTLEHR